MQKFSSFGRKKKKKQTTIQHRMVMLRHLQLLKLQFTAMVIQYTIFV